MERKDFKQEMTDLNLQMKEKFLTEYFSDHSCLSRKEEEKLLMYIRKIQVCLEAL